MRRLETPSPLKTPRDCLDECFESLINMLENQSYGGGVFIPSSETQSGTSVRFSLQRSSDGALFIEIEDDEGTVWGNLLKTLTQTGRGRWNRLFGTFGIQAFHINASQKNSKLQAHFSVPEAMLRTCPEHPAQTRTPEGQVLREAVTEVAGSFVTSEENHFRDDNELIPAAKLAASPDGARTSTFGSIRRAGDLDWNTIQDQAGGVAGGFVREVKSIIQRGERPPLEQRA